MDFLRPECRVWCNFVLACNGCPMSCGQQSPACAGIVLGPSLPRPWVVFVASILCSPPIRFLGMVVASGVCPSPVMSELCLFPCCCLALSLAPVAVRTSPLFVLNLNITLSCGRDCCCFVCLRVMCGWFVPVLAVLVVIADFV